MSILKGNVNLTSVNLKPDKVNSEFLQDSPI